MGLIGLTMAHYCDLCGILTGLTKSTDHPSVRFRISRPECSEVEIWGLKTLWCTLYRDSSKQIRAPHGSFQKHTALIWTPDSRALTTWTPTKGTSNL